MGRQPSDGPYGSGHDLQPAVSLLISSRNRPHLLIEAVQSVLRGRILPDEIIVVDQSDQQNCALLAMEFPAGVAFRYVQSATTGTSRSRNEAFAAASHPIIVVIDDDCFVAAEWLGAIVRELIASGPRCVITGRVLAGEAEQDGAFAPSLHTGSEPVRHEGRILTDPLATFNFALYAATYAEIGPFDSRLGPGTRFPSSEDNDYGNRLLLAGYTIVFTPSAVVYHRAWRPADAYISVRYAYGRGQGAYYAKHIATGDLYMAWKFVHALRRRVRRMLAKDRVAVIGELAWILGWAAGFAEWLLLPAARRDGSTSV